MCRISRMYEYIHDNSQENQSCSDPERQPRHLDWHCLMHRLDFSQKQSETGYNKTEAHQCQPGSHSGKDSSLNGETDPRVFGVGGCHWPGLHIR
jgi:hypothetical protein